MSRRVPSLTSQWSCPVVVDLMDCRAGFSTSAFMQQIENAECTTVILKGETDVPYECPERDIQCS
ncbi:hypothetical protein RUM44_002028 [Polyplax serrata]|uniref:Uncharacterized protein n=1 Tax=Polyplax serrata TaxID=468196 RepID=A0ABR1ALU4_POLSC